MLELRKERRAKKRAAKRAKKAGLAEQPAKDASDEAEPASV
jgi:HAE1 family hydrophobic/amphiphilic exporter-1